MMPIVRMNDSLRPYFWGRSIVQGFAESSERKMLDAGIFRTELKHK